MISIKKVGFIMKKFKRVMSILLTMLLLLTMSVSAMAFTVDEDAVLPRRARCPGCNSGYLMSSTSPLTSWTSTGDYDCKHDLMGYDDNQGRRYNVKVWCDSQCGYGSDFTNVEYRLVCRGY